MSESQSKQAESFNHTKTTNQRHGFPFVPLDRCEELVQRVRILIANHQSMPPEQNFVLFTDFIEKILSQHSGQTITLIVILGSIFAFNLEGGRKGLKKVINKRATLFTSISG